MLIVKIGGGSRINLEGIVADLKDIDQPCIIVHGANVLRDEVARKMGIEKQVVTSIKGFSSVFSDQPALDAILMSYSGLRNKRIVELCQQQGINAIGLTGIDGRLIQGKRNRGIRVEENGKKMLKKDFSGKPVSINLKLLQSLLDGGFLPVITIPICDEDGFAINSENDDIVNCLQQATGADTILQLIEAPGFLENADQPDSIVTAFTRQEIASLLEQVDGRMKRKIHALSKMAGGNVKTIVISDGRVDHPVREALAGGGTWIQ